MADHIPDELLIEILARLPVASLVRFKSVSKSWYSLIARPSFITKHLNQTITNSRRNDSKLFVTCEHDGKKKRYLLLHDDEKFGHECTELEFPHKLSVGSFRLVGSCNGLVCLCHYFSGNSQIIIWNPSIRKSVTLPMPFKPQRHCKVVYGFGADPTTHEYKVVRIYYESGVMEDSYEIPPKAEIYEQGTSWWRGVSSAAPSFNIVNFDNSISQAFFNGVVHWVAYGHCEDGSPRNLIISFNMASESFSEIMLPPALADQFLFCLSIKLFGESLAVSCNGERNGGASNIWVMKEYGVAGSWTKLFSSNLPRTPHVPLGFRINGEVFLVSSHDCYLSSYVPENIPLRDTGIRGILLACYVGSFIETLVLTEKINGVPQGQLNLS